MYRNGVLERETRALRCAFGEICRKIEKFITVSRAEPPRQTVSARLSAPVSSSAPSCQPPPSPIPPTLPRQPPLPAPHPRQLRLPCHLPLSPVSPVALPPPPLRVIVLLRCRVNAVYDDDSVLCDMAVAVMVGAISVDSVRMAFRHSRGLRLRPLCESGFHLR